MHYRTELMEKILTSPEAQKIIDYVTPKYGAAYVCLWLFQAIGSQIDNAQEFTDEFIKQVSPATATWSIPYWEKSYGIIPDPEWTDEQRRNYIISRMKFHSPMNPRIMEIRLTNILGVETVINEFAGKNFFKVVVRKNMNDSEFKKLAIDFLDKAKPAHLIYDIQFSDIVENAVFEHHYDVSVTEQDIENITVIADIPGLYLINDTGQIYKLFVMDDKLRMQESESESPSEYYVVSNNETGQTYRLYVHGEKLMLEEDNSLTSDGYLLVLDQKGDYHRLHVLSGKMVMD